MWTWFISAATGAGRSAPGRGEVEELRFVSAAELPDAIMPPNRPALTDWARGKRG